MSKSPFRIIFMGTPDFAVPSLAALISGPDQIIAVVTQPDRPKGRSRKPSAPPIKVLAKGHHLEVLQPDKIKTKQFTHTLQHLRPDIIVVAAYGRILPPQILSLPRHGCINVHGSLLPRHRGAAPIQWSIIKGDPRVGVTIIQMDEGMDTGDILYKASITPETDETAGTLYPKLAELGSQALMETLDQLRTQRLSVTTQDNDLATAAPMFAKNDGLIDWNTPAQQLDCLIRGLDPWPTVFCNIKGKKLQLYAPEVIHQDSSQKPGILLRADRTGLLVSTSHSCLLIREVKPEGKKRMDVADFLNGYPLEVGTLLSGKDS